MRAWMIRLSAALLLLALGVAGARQSRQLAQRRFDGERAVERRRRRRGRQLPGVRHQFSREIVGYLQIERTDRLGVALARGAQEVCVGLGHGAEHGVTAAVCAVLQRHQLGAAQRRTIGPIDRNRLAGRVDHGA